MDTVKAASVGMTFGPGANSHLEQRAELESEIWRWPGTGRMNDKIRHAQTFRLLNTRLRENKMIATAGADRLQEGMRKAFGKPIGLAARVEVGSVILEMGVKAENLEKAKEAMHAASAKLPMKTKVQVVPLQKPVAQ